MHLRMQSTKQQRHHHLLLFNSIMEHQCACNHKFIQWDVVKTRLETQQERGAGGYRGTMYGFISK